MGLLLMMGGPDTPDPRSLFSNNEAGLALDVETAYRRGWVYQDSAGATVAAAAGDPVGLILDTAKGGLDNLGPELLANTGFSTDTVWSKSGTTISGGTANWTSAAGSSSVSQSAILTVGKFYLVCCDLVSWSSGAIRFRDGTTDAIFPNSSTLGKKQLIFRATNTSAQFIVFDASATLSIDNCSVREIPGNHAYQTTSGSRPALARTPDGGRRNLLTGTDAMATQSLTVLAVQHTLSFQGTGTVTLSGASTSGPLVGTGAANIVSLTFTPTAGSLTLTVTGTVQLAQLETAAARTTYQKVGLTSDVTEAGKRDCWGLLFDGSDDSLQTASVNFSATDKMTVMAGVRKNSDAARGMLVELSASLGANTGTFLIAGPDFAVATDRWAAYIRGDGANQSYVETSAAYAAPVTNVLTMTGDLSLSVSEAVLRINSAVRGSTTVGDAGGGNFGTYPLYIGSRAGSSVRLDGLIYTLIIRGATTPTGTIADFERNLLARRCGVTF
jgi:hypothetical protein